MRDVVVVAANPVQVVLDDFRLDPGNLLFVRDLFFRDLENQIHLRLCVLAALFLAVPIDAARVVPSRLRGAEIVSANLPVVDVDILRGAHGALFWLLVIFIALRCVGHRDYIALTGLAF